MNSRAWLQRELRNVHLDDYAVFVDDVRHINYDDCGTGLAIEDMVAFLPSCPELAGKEHTFHVLKLCCLCLVGIVPNLSNVELGFGRIGTAKVDVSYTIEPLQGYFVSRDSKGSFLTDLDSIDACLASLENFCDKTLQIDYNPWSFVNFQDCETIYSELAESYKAVEIPTNVESSSSLKETVFAPEELPKQRRRAAHRPRIDVKKPIFLLRLLYWLIKHVPLANLLELNFLRNSFA